MYDLNPVWVLLLALFAIAWWRQVRSENAGWVDVLWAACTALFGAAFALTGQGDFLLRALTAALYVLAYGRLALYLLRRVARDPEEDGRYRALRDWAGPRAPWVFGLFYLAQAGFVWLFTWPARVLAEGTLPPTWALVVGLTLWLTGQAGVRIADRQLDAFRRRPENRGRTCRDGLWRYSRHPNYFFEWLHSFTWPLLALNSPGGALLWGFPLLVFAFLYAVTGIPHTEKQALRSRGNDYRRYQRATSPFIPWRPKHESDQHG